MLHHSRTGGNTHRREIRKILLNRAHGEMTALSELFLYEAARSQHVIEVIRPLMRKKG